jgi:uncharacterized protein
MMFGWESVALYMVLGSAVGIVSGTLGIGGGGLIVPSLTAIFLMQGMPHSQVVHMALGTSMATILVTSSRNLIIRHKKGDVLWNIVKMMAPGVLLGAFAATFLVAHLSSLFLSVFFSVFMTFVAVQMYSNKEPKPHRKVLGRPWLFVVSFFVGAVSAMVSIGGAVLNVPFFLWQNINIQKAMGTATAIAFPVAVSATVGYMVNGWHNTNLHHFIVGYVSLPAFVVVALFSALTVPVGIKLSYSLPVGVLKKIFALLFVLLSIKMLSSFI